MTLIALGVGAQDSGQSSAEQARIVNLENAWNQALWQKDATALNLILGPELVFVDYDGKLMSKAEYFG